MNKSLHTKVHAVIAILAMALIFYGCSDDGQQSAAPKTSKAQKEAKHVPVVVMPQQNIPPKVVKKEEAERPLKIGVIGPETGPSSIYGLSVLDGAMSAAKSLNAHGGIDGKDIEVIHYDNKDDLGLTRKSVQDLVDQKVIAILSAPTGWSTFAPTRKVNQTHTLFFSIGSRRRIGRSGPYVFRAALPDELATAELIKYTIKELGYINYALVTSSQYDYSLDLSASFKQALLKHGAVIKIDADTYDTYTGQKDYGKVVEAIKNSPDVQAVIFTGGVDEAVVIAKGLEASGLSLPIIGGEDLFTAEFLAAGDVVQGSLVYSTFAPDYKSPQTVEFLQGYEKGSPDRFAALAYDSFLLLAEAIKMAGNTKPTKVREALIALKDFEGATGATSFTPKGGVIKSPFIHRVESGDEGAKFVLVKPQ